MLLEVSESAVRNCLIHNLHLIDEVIAYAEEDIWIRWQKRRASRPGQSIIVVNESTKRKLEVLENQPLRKEDDLLSPSNVRSGQDPRMDIMSTPQSLSSFLLASDSVPRFPTELSLKISESTSTDDIGLSGAETPVVEKEKESNSGLDNQQENEENETGKEKEKLDSASKLSSGIKDSLPEIETENVAKVSCEIPERCADSRNDDETGLEQTENNLEKVGEVENGKETESPLVVGSMEMCGKVSSIESDSMQVEEEQEDISEEEDVESELQTVNDDLKIRSETETKSMEEVSKRKRDDSCERMSLSEGDDLVDDVVNDDVPVKDNGACSENDDGNDGNTYDDDDDDDDDDDALCSSCVKTCGITESGFCHRNENVDEESCSEKKAPEVTISQTQEVEVSRVLRKSSAPVRKRRRTLEVVGNEFVVNAGDKEVEKNKDDRNSSKLSRFLRSAKTRFSVRSASVGRKERAKSLPIEVDNPVTANATEISAELPDMFEKLSGEFSEKMNQQSVPAEKAEESADEEEVEDELEEEESDDEIAEKPEMFNCKYCDRAFTKKRLADKHAQHHKDGTILPNWFTKKPSKEKEIKKVATKVKKEKVAKLLRKRKVEKKKVPKVIVQKKQGRPIKNIFNKKKTETKKKQKVVSAAVIGGKRKRGRPPKTLLLTKKSNLVPKDENKTDDALSTENMDDTNDWADVLSQSSCDELSQNNSKPDGPSLENSEHISDELKEKGGDLDEPSQEENSETVSDEPSHIESSDDVAETPDEMMTSESFDNEEGMENSAEMPSQLPPVNVGESQNVMDTYEKYVRPSCSNTGSENACGFDSGNVSQNDSSFAELKNVDLSNVVQRAADTTVPMTPDAADGIQRHQCTLCDKQLSTFLEVIAHSLSGENEKNICAVCGKNFSSVSELKKHAKLYFKKKKPKKDAMEILERSPPIGEGSSASRNCPLCMQRCLNVQMHIDQNHTCNVCQRVFVWNSQLRDHFIIAHSHEYPHQCAVCLKGFLRRGLKEKHEQGCWARQYKKQLMQAKK